VNSFTEISGCFAGKSSLISFPIGHFGTVSGLSTMPVTRYEVDYGALILVIILVIGFVYELMRGAARRFEKNPTEQKGGTAGLLARAFIETIFLDIFASAPLADCHSQAYYARRPHTKRVAHLLIFYGFLLTLIATGLGFLFDKWITPYEFSEAYYLGSAGSMIETGLGVIGGAMMLAGIVIYWPIRYRGEDWKTTSLADLFLFFLAFTVITGFILEAAEAYSAYIAPAFWVHMAFVVALFATMPFTKFSHALYQIIWNTYNRFEKKVASYFNKEVK